MTDILLLAFLFLIAGVIAVPIASRSGLGSVLGYLLAGIILSPLLSLLKVDIVAIQHFAEFGVVMMLFLVGLELNPKLLWDMRGRLLGLGGGQIALTTLAIMGIALFLNIPWSIALTIGIILSLSSTAIVLQSLEEKGLMRGDGGQACFSILLFQDIAVIPILALLPLLALSELGVVGADTGAHSSLSLVEHLNSWQTALVTIGAIALVGFGGSFLTRHIFRFIAVARLRELFTAVALMMIVGIALLMSLVGLSPALGTFLAGLVLANSEYRHELESSIAPFKGLLLGLFFMTVGAGINFALLSEEFGPIVGLTLALIAIKGVVIFVLGHFLNIDRCNRWLVSLGLAQAGEFGFVLISFSLMHHIIPSSIASQLQLIVALSMLLTPLLFIVYDRLIVPHYAKTQTREMDAINEQNSVIIAGRGRVGGIIDRMLVGAGIKSTVIDYSSKQLEFLKKFGVHTYFGDATQPDLLHSAGIMQAKILIIAIDGKDQITELVRYATKNYPHLHVIARAVTRDHVYILWANGCRDIIRETYDSSIRMGRSAYEALGVDRERAQRMADKFEEIDRKAMVEVADAYDINLPPEENTAYIAKIKKLVERWEGDLGRQIIAIKDEP
jgi:CPA2 family monovalent cation:H+ antiporter-2